MGDVQCSIEISVRVREEGGYFYIFMYLYYINLMILELYRTECHSHKNNEI